MILRFDCWLVLLAVCCVALADVEVSTDEIEFENNTFVDNNPFQADKCYCGLFSKSCSYVEGKKTCICDDLYADYLGTCTRCLCKHANFNNGCEFDDSGRKKCNCLEGYAQLDGDCQVCNCGKHGNCTLSGWGKTCQCEEGYAANYGTCEKCDCGEHGRCSLFSGIKECYCNSGFAENYFGKCQECECGNFSICRFNSRFPFTKKCICQKGYAFKSEVCTPCDCGANGRCTFNEGIKQCDCNHGFAQNDRGKCEECDCQMDDSNCTIDGGLKKCQCPKGFEPSKDYTNPVCIDKDMCLSPEDNDCDPLSTKCVNSQQGSYDCECKEGFQHIRNILGNYDTKKDGCKDIDECWDYSPCINLHTRCVNTPGSYRCECAAGYSLEKDSYAEKYNSCSEDARPWKTASIVVGCLFGFVSLGLLIAICIRHSTL